MDRFIIMEGFFLLFNELITNSCHISIEVIKLEIIIGCLSKSLQLLFSKLNWIFGWLLITILQIGWFLLTLLFVYLVLCEYLLNTHSLFTCFRCRLGCRFRSKFIYFYLSIEVRWWSKFVLYVILRSWYSQLNSHSPHVIKILFYQIICCLITFYYVLLSFIYHLFLLMKFACHVWKLL